LQIGNNPTTLADFGYIQYVQDTDYHTIAFLNDNTYYASDGKEFKIEYYNSSDASMGSVSIKNEFANGGYNPYGEGTPNVLPTPAQSLLYFGCGPGNLEAQTAETTARPSNFSGYKFYTVRAINSTAKSAPYYFIKQNGSCKGFKVRRLAWTNTVGGYDYWNFNMKSTQTLSVERNNYNSLVGIYNKSVWRYNDTDRGKTTRQTTASLKETLNTDWLSETEATLMESLLMSTNVYILENSDTEFTQGVMVTDSSIIKKTVANDKLIQYTINIEYANPVNTNS